LCVRRDPAGRCHPVTVRHHWRARAAPVRVVAAVVLLAGATTPLLPRASAAQQRERDDVLGFAHFLLDGLLRDRPQAQGLRKALERDERAGALSGRPREAFLAALDSAVVAAIRERNPGFTTADAGVAALMFGALYEAGRRIDALPAGHPRRPALRASLDSVQAAYRQSMRQPSNLLRDLEAAIGEAERPRGRVPTPAAGPQLQLPIGAAGHGGEGPPRARRHRIDPFPPARPRPPSRAGIRRPLLVRQFVRPYTWYHGTGRGPALRMSDRHTTLPAGGQHARDCSPARPGLLCPAAHGR
jgi:hypothetical protein